MIISAMVMDPSISKAFIITSVTCITQIFLGELNTCHLLHLVIQFCEVMKHDSISFVQSFFVSDKFKGITHRKAHLHCQYCIVDMTN